MSPSIEGESSFWNRPIQGVGRRPDIQVQVPVSATNLLSLTVAQPHFFTGKSNKLDWTSDFFTVYFKRDIFIWNICKAMHTNKIKSLLWWGAVEVSFVALDHWAGCPKLPSCSGTVFYDLFSLSLDWIGKVTYIGPAEMVSINVKHRHDIEIQMIHHFSHDWITPIG